MTTLPKGTQIGRYRISDVLGVGGFGITYRADAEQDDQDYAIKELFPANIVMRAQNGSLQISKPEQFEAEKAAFMEEARALKRFDRHPSIVKVVEVLEKNNTAYLVMYLVDGWDLPKRVGAKSMGFTNPFKLSEWQPILLPLLDALDELHNAKPMLLHRDIAPANLRLTHGGKTAVLLDFGAAREVSANLSQALSAVLTPGFAPYEQYTLDDEDLENEGVTSEELGVLPKQGPWTDVYSLGAVSYYALTARRPTVSILRKSRIGAALVPLSERLRDDPEFDKYRNLITSIDKAMAIEPRDRFQSAGAWRQAILPVKPPPPPPPPPPPSKGPKGLKLWQIFILVVLLAIIGFAIGQMTSRQTSDASESVESDAAPSALDSLAKKEPAPVQPIKEAPAPLKSDAAVPARVDPKAASTAPYNVKSAQDVKPAEGPNKPQRPQERPSEKTDAKPERPTKSSTNGCTSDAGYPGC